jgi:pyruvate formate lyase activating enzyme
MPGIKGLLETSFLDWPGQVCAVLFLGGCNFRCPFCHNHPLVLKPEAAATIPLEEAVDRLTAIRRWLGGICISGGEPTLDRGLPDMIRFLKTRGWRIKLDTNGSRPQVLANLLGEGLLDAVSMDVKAPLKQEKYRRCAGLEIDLELIRQSISLLGESGIEHEFRMTILPSFHTEADILEWAATFGQGSARLTLQNFNPRSTLDPQLMKEKGFTEEQLASFRRLISSPAKNNSRA